MKSCMVALSLVVASCLHALPGVGDKSKEIFNPNTPTQAVVDTYGWCMRKNMSGTLANCCGWARQVASELRVNCIDLSAIVASCYNSLASGALKPLLPIHIRKPAWSVHD